MNCKNCNAPVADGVVFCGSCGVRVDGKKACASCGQFNDANQKYCSHCGARIDGKTVCQKCGTEYEGRFCFNCGNGNFSANEKKKGKANGKSSQEMRKGAGQGGNTILRIISASFALAAASLAFIFVFFIGVKTKTSYGSFDRGEKFGIFNYLFNLLKRPVYYKYYSSVEKVLFNVRSIGLFLISLATVALVTIFTVFTVIKFVKMMIKKEDDGCLRWGVVTAIVYIAGASLLYAMESYYYVSGELWQKVAFNGLTIAGVVFCCVLLVGTVVCKVLENPATFKERWFTTRKVCALIGTAVATVTFLVATHTGLKFDGWDYDSNYGYTDMAVGGSPITMAAAKGDVDAALIGIIGQLMLTLTIAFLALSLIRWMRNAVETQYKSGLPWAILSAIFAIMTLLLVILLGEYMLHELAGDGTEGSKQKFVMPILLVVFSLIHLGTTIAGKIIHDRNSVENIEE